MKVIGAVACKGKIKKLWRYLESRESDATTLCCSSSEPSSDFTIFEVISILVREGKEEWG